MTVFRMTAYPKEVELPSEHSVTIRPMRADDDGALLEFFLRIPEDERFYLKEDVRAPGVIRHWAENLNYSRALPLLAYRGVGLGARLIQELIDLGRALELEKLFFELVDRREMGAIHAAATAGFEEVAVLRDRVKDAYGSLQDLVIMERTLGDEMAFGHF